MSAREQAVQASASPPAPSAEDLHRELEGAPLPALPLPPPRQGQGGVQLHLPRAAPFAVHYRLPQWIAVFAYEGARSLSAMDNGPLESGLRARGSACLIPPGTRVRVLQETPQQMMTLVMPAERVTHLIQESGVGDEAQPRSSEDDPALAALFGELRRVVTSEPTADPAYLSTVCDAAIGRLLTRSHPMDGQPRHPEPGKEMLTLPLTRLLASTIEQRLDERLTVGELAALAKLSRSHFTRAFTATFGESPGRYLLSRRIERGKALLADSTAPIVEIALLCGFSNHAHFSTAFRGETGMTPRAFRLAVGNSITY